jgi:hypothetical protein
MSSSLISHICDICQVKTEPGRAHLLRRSGSTKAYRRMYLSGAVLSPNFPLCTSGTSVSRMRAMPPCWIYSHKESYIVPTPDADFHTLSALPGATFPSVIRLRIEVLRGEALANLLADATRADEGNARRGCAAKRTLKGYESYRLQLKNESGLACRNRSPAFCYFYSSCLAPINMGA